MSRIVWSVFTKLWKTMPLEKLGRFLRGLGFDAVELPVRPGFQVQPASVAKDLPAAAKVLADCGLAIASISGPCDEPTFAACQACGVKINRLCEFTGGQKYLEAEAKIIARYKALVPLLDKYGVRIGLQNHCDGYVANSTQMLRICEKFAPAQVGAVWDAAHNAINGEVPEQAIDILWSHLCMVNLKNAVWRRTNGPEAAIAKYEILWTSGRQGLAPWPKVAEELNKRNFSGIICLTAEYTDESSVNRLIADDIAFAKGLFAS
ncbi:MAG: sugar phosphate isomerase/epimerase family protein [Phycisphaerae bacterium]